MTNAFLALLSKDVKLELRSKEFLGVTFMFALLVIIIFNFAFTLTPQNRPELSAGILWIAFLFSGTLGLGRSFQVEKENEAFQALLLTPVDRMVIYWAKLAGNLIFLTAIQAVIIPIFILLYNLNVMEQFFKMSAVLLLGDFGFMTLGTILSAISVNLRARELLMPVLLLPLLVPLIIFAVSATSILIQHGSMDVYNSRVHLLIAFDVIFFVVSSLTFEYIVDE